MHELVVPAALAGARIDRDDRFGEQVVSRPVPAVVVAGRQLHGEIDQAELLVRAHLRPHARVARVRPGIAEPRVVAELVRLRDRVEDPQPLASPHVVAADVPLDVGPAARRSAGCVHGPDDDDIPDHDRRGRQPDIAGQQIDLLIHAALQVDDAVAPERGDRLTGRGVQRHELIAEGDVEDARLHPVAPPGEPAANGNRRRPRTLSLVQPMAPQQTAGGRVDRHRGTPRCAGEVQHAADHQRRRAAGPQAVLVEAPGQLEAVEVVRGDLRERGVARAGQVAAVGGPLASLDSALPEGRRDDAQGKREWQCRRKNAPGRSASASSRGAIAHPGGDPTRVPHHGHAIASGAR